MYWEGQEYKEEYSTKKRSSNGSGTAGPGKKLLKELNIKNQELATIGERCRHLESNYRALWVVNQTNQHLVNYLIGLGREMYWEGQEYKEEYTSLLNYCREQYYRSNAGTTPTENI
ncbi:hypothetical protein OS493_035004 [Desmophyllum pertusum]|uniref:Uncharacterized protein n=1 Tax=Desmophyllum pertusum TaxID=174260 RepID=A0A9W9Y7P4_9CNID|nr:hypothetical protein OS493_035004 [Desmophyllum pertusum]